jgi:hypothetical protein
MGNQASSGVYTGAPPPRKAKPLYKDMEEAWKLIGACMLLNGERESVCAACTHGWAWSIEAFAKGFGVFSLIFGWLC